MKLNKFLQYKIHNRVGEGDDEDALMSGGSGSAGGPVTLTLEQIQNELLALDKKLEGKGLVEGTDEYKAAQEQARAELVKLMRENDEINFSEENFAKAVGLTPAQATAQYYNYDFTDKDYLFPNSGDYGVVIRSAFTDYDPDSIAAYEAKGGKSVFRQKPDSSFTPPDVTLEDVRVATDFASPTPDQLVTQLDAFLPRNRQVARVTQNTPAFTVANKLGTTMFDRINFPERTINRGVPVVTKGIDAQGNPTTSITMGNAAASPSGPTIGDLDISAVLPSTGMLVNADGTGGATVGTQAGSGNIVGSSADTLKILDPGVPSNPVSSVDDNVVGLAGNQVASTLTPVKTGTICPLGSEREGMEPDENGFCNPLAEAAKAGGAGAGTGTGGAGTGTGGAGGTGTVCPLGTELAGMEPDANGSCNPQADAAAAAKAAQTADIQNLFTTSQTKDIAAQRIGDYAAQAGGITAEAIAEAVKPVLSQKTDFGIGADAGAADVLEAVDQFGYGTKTPLGMHTTGIDYHSPIYGAGTTPPQDLQQITGGMAPDLAGKQAALQFLNTQDAAIGTGPYTETEAAMRGLDYAKRNQMSLADAGAAFGMTADDVRARADTLGIDLGAVGFAHGGEVEDSRDAAVGSRLMAQAGIGSMQGQSMSPEMAGTIDRIMARRK